jgi:hypothetical protein
VPTTPKRRARKSKTTVQTAAQDSELPVAKKMIPLTFGTVLDSEHYPEGITLTLEGVGKRRGVALTSDRVVKMSPATFAAMWN